MSSRPLRTYAGALIESRICCTLGRTRSWVGRRRAGLVDAAARTRSNTCPLGFVELQCSGDPFEHVLGDTASVAAFESRVVLDADPGQHRDLFAAQARYPAIGAVGGEAHLFRGELGPSRDEELADVVPRRPCRQR